jgi:hypothetical protein
MEGFLVTHMGEGLWSVSHQGQTLSVYPTEEQALSATFKRASKLSPSGLKTAVSIARAGTGSEVRRSTRIHR